MHSEERKKRRGNGHLWIIHGVLEPRRISNANNQGGKVKKEGKESAKKKNHSKWKKGELS